jgi:hypothetical protein
MGFEPKNFKSLDGCDATDVEEELFFCVISDALRGGGELVTF